ncbi:AbrB/MazE/SpoVT family DNA-binding domain-containing protein [Oscillibacter sp.]|uniref:AbrB/MazE/SpoVT family DNA-binding domain-containing protein n=1 Tax=Oscillibacter sp. TaxID=1945593 RepID=UPI0033954F35
MVMRRKITQQGRINIGDEARGSILTGKVTVSGSTQGILITPYHEGDENRPDCKVTAWDADNRIVLPLQLRQKARLESGDTVDLLFRDEDGGILLVAARDVCTLCGSQSDDMIRMPNGRLVCPRCRRILCKDE